MTYEWTNPGKLGKPLSVHPGIPMTPENRIAALEAKLGQVEVLLTLALQHSPTLARTASDFLKATSTEIRWRSLR